MNYLKIISNMTCLVHLIVGIINHGDFNIAMKHKAIMVFTFMYLFSMAQMEKIEIK